MIDDTHDPARTSWVTSANGHGAFPIQNLPFGVFSTENSAPRGGVAIGDEIFDISAALEAGLFSGAALEAAQLASGRSLNPFLQAGPAARVALRRRIGELLDAKGPEANGAQNGGQKLLHNSTWCRMHLPARIGDFTDFFAGIHHARTGGMINRPENPLMPNYKYVPVAYHSRASSVRPSGGLVRRPNGQRKPPDQAEPDFGPCRNLDYELELGVWIGTGNELGAPIPIGQASNHIAGFCLVNDWSARDIQSWESQPLGPFLAKSLSTFVSPWIITPEALEPFRSAQAPRPPGDPAPLSYLNDPVDQAHGAVYIDLLVFSRDAIPPRCIGRRRRWWRTTRRMDATSRRAICSAAARFPAPNPDRRDACWK
jgi:fumarylacetoacetase